MRFLIAILMFTGLGLLPNASAQTASKVKVKDKSVFISAKGGDTVKAGEALVQIRAYPNNNGPANSLDFTNLVPGKIYRYTCKHKCNFAGTGARRCLTAVIHNSTTILECDFDGDSTNGGLAQLDASNTVIFVATGTTITHSISVQNATLLGDGTTGNSFSMLEELGNYSFTNKFQ